MLRTPSGSKPGSNFASAAKLRPNSAAPTSSVTVTAIWTGDDRLQRAAAGAAARFDRAFAQILRERMLAHRAQRREADHDGDQHAEPDDERERAPVDAGRRETRQLHRAQREQRIAGPHRQQHARGAAERDDPRALRQHQANQPALVGADRAPQREFAAARFGAREQQARHAGARDHEHERDRAEQQRDRRPNLPEHFVGERRHFDAALLVGLGIGLLELLRDVGDVGLRLRERHAGREPRQRRKAAAAAVRRAPAAARRDHRHPHFARIRCGP